MSAEREIERVLETWFADGVNQMPDRVYRTVIDRVDRQPQRRWWRLLPWRSSAVNTPLKLVLIGAAIVLALAAGTILIGGNGGIGIAPKPTPTPTVAPTPTPTPTPTPVPSPTTLPDGLLLPGTYVSQPYADSSLAWTVTVPGGWNGSGGWVFIDTPKDRGIIVGPMKVLDVPKDSCAPKVTTPARSVDALISAIRARTDWTVSAPVDTSLGGYAGKRIDVETPANVDCPGGADYVVFSESPDGSGFHAQGPSNRFTLWILDVDGSPLVIMRNSYAESTAETMAQSDAMVDSIVITP
jgi:hypothetical protein